MQPFTMLNRCCSGPELRQRWTLSAVWSTWATLLAAAAVICFLYSRNIPYSEDWLLVAPLTGNEPDLAYWLWALHHDHRIPLPKLLMLAILKMAGGDFRAIVLCNVALFGVISALLLNVVHRIRGRSALCDAFFPILLLHPGNIENMLWPWQMTFVLSIVLIYIYLAALVRQGGLLRVSNAVVSGICLILLPLTGATGLLFAAPAAMWGAVLGIATLRMAQHRAGLTLLAFSAGALGVVGLYFAGYQPSDLTASHPVTVGPIVWAALQCLALSFGPASKSIALIAVAVTTGVVACGLVIAARGTGRSAEPEQRAQAAGLFVFVGIGCGYALALSVGREELVNGLYGGWPLRYSSLMAPTLCGVYFIFERVGCSQLKRQKWQYGLLLLLILAFPLNAAHGLTWTHWYSARVGAAWNDAQAGQSASEIARRNATSLAFEAEDLAKLIPMLQEAKVGPFAQSERRQVQSSLKSGNDADSAIPYVTQRIRYQLPGAEEVFVVWGVNGWHPVPLRRRPPGTALVNGAMSTPLIRQDEWFTGTITAPRDTRIDYGFSIKTKAAEEASSVIETWDGDPAYHMISGAAKIADIRSKLKMAGNGRFIYAGAGVRASDLVIRQIRYRSARAATVSIDWGVNGWNLLPQELRPAGSTVEEGVHRARMVRHGDVFIQSLLLPRGVQANFGFLITRKRGLLERLINQALPGNANATKLLAPLFGVDAQSAWIYDRSAQYQITDETGPAFETASKTATSDEYSPENLPTLQSTASGILTFLLLAGGLFSGFTALCAARRH